MSCKVELEYNENMDVLIDETSGSGVMISQKGAEVISFVVKDTENDMDIPLMWNDGKVELPFDGAWKNHATVLFPVIGGLKDKKSKLGDTEINFKGNHGLSRFAFFDTVDFGSGETAWVKYKMRITEEDAKRYPFKYSFYVTYTLKGIELSVDFDIVNEDDKDIYASVGWHPGVSTSWGDLKGNRDDWELIFNKGNILQLLNDPECFLTGETKELKCDGNKEFVMTEKGLEDTYMFEANDISMREYKLINKKLNRGYKVTSESMEQFGVWALPGQEYICLEPWQGIDDYVDQTTFDKKRGMMCIKVGETVRKSSRLEPLFEV